MKAGVGSRWQIMLQRIHRLAMVYAHPARQLCSGTNREVGLQRVSVEASSQLWYRVSDR